MQSQHVILAAPKLLEKLMKQAGSLGLPVCSALPAYIYCCRSSYVQVVDGRRKVCHRYALHFGGTGTAANRISSTPHMAVTHAQLHNACCYS
jgi:hypothetical protein